MHATQGSEEAGLTGLGWVGLVDQVHCRQMVEGRYGVLLILFYTSRKHPLYTVRTYMRSCVHSAGHVCLVVQVAAHTNSTFIYVFTYSLGFTHLPLDHCMSTTAVCVCEHMLPPAACAHKPLCSPE